MCLITRIFKDVICCYTGDLMDVIAAPFDLNVWTVHMGLNSDEPCRGGIQPCGTERACQYTHTMKAQN